MPHQTTENSTDVKIRTAEAVSVNVARDFTWTYFSYENLNTWLHSTKDAHYDISSQWFGQQIWSTGTTFTASALGLLAVRFYNGRQKDETSKLNYTNYLRDSIIYAMAASTAVYTWNRGQQLGIYLGQRVLGLSNLGSAYFASIFTGSFEGPTQYLCIKLGNAIMNLASILKDPQKRNEFELNPKKVLTELGIFSLELGFSATVGAIPGAVWQIVYAACVAGGLGAIPTSALVAVAVATCNIGVAATDNGIRKYFSDKPSCAFFSSTTGDGTPQYVQIQDSEESEPTNPDYGSIDNGKEGTQANAIAPASGNS